MRKRSLFILLSIFLLMLTAFGIYVYREYNRPPAKTTERKTDHSLTAVMLLQEFSSNELSANEKYIGKTLEVEGIVKEVSREEDNTFMIHLAGADELSTVRCRMESSQDKDPGILKAGEQVHIKGLCNGFNADDMGLGTDVLLTQCILK